MSERESALRNVEILTASSSEARRQVSLLANQPSTLGDAAFMYRRRTCMARRRVREVTFVRIGHQS